MSFLYFTADYICMHRNSFTLKECLLIHRNDVTTSHSSVLSCCRTAAQPPPPPAQPLTPAQPQSESAAQPAEPPTEPIAAEPAPAEPESAAEPAPTSRATSESHAGDLAFCGRISTHTHTHTHTHTRCSRPTGRTCYSRVISYVVVAVFVTGTMNLLFFVKAKFHCAI